MKKLTLTALLFALFSTCFSQVYKLRSYSSEIKTKGKYGWTKWSEPTENNILIVINVDKDRVTIYSKETQVYDIFKVYNKFTDDDANKLLAAKYHNGYELPKV